MSFPRLIAAGIYLGVLLTCGQAAAQQVPDGPLTADGRPVPVAPAVIARNDKGVAVRATRISTPLNVDGALDEPVYEQVRAITEFEQQDPDEGAPVSEKTEAWVFYDDKFLYVSCRCFDQNPDRIVANDMRRDSSNLRQNDNFGLSLDTFHDRRNGFLFYVTPVGGLFDALTTEERAVNADWNTIVDVEVGRFAGGWTAEIAIPFKSLRYPPGRDQTWGIIIRRTIRAKNEYSYIVPIRPQWAVGGIFHMSAAATLIGIEAPPAGKNLEIKPFAISRLTTDMLARPSVRNDVTREFGIDAKYGITKSLTADFTYNTDFAQVEADEVQVNLTRFNLQFPEKRDFFLEGQGVFTFGTVGGGGGGVMGATRDSGSSDAPTIFYSRQIGLTAGRVVPIIGGARLSGKLGKFSLGALNITSDEDESSGAKHATFTVLRVRRDVLRRSTVGLLMTRRSASAVGPGSNDVFGVDGSFSLYDNVYLTTYLAKSRTDGREGRDVSYRSNFAYTSDRYSFQADRIGVGDNFNPEVGFLTRQSFRRNFASARFSPRPKRNRVIRKYFYDASLNYETDNSNRLESRSAVAAFRVELQNSDAFHLEYFRDYELLKRPFAPAGGILIPAGGYGFQHLRTAWAPGQQHRLSGTVAFDAGSFYDGTKQTFSVNARYYLTPQLGVEPNISLNRIERKGTRVTVKATGARTTFTMTPRMFVGALVQYASSSSSITTNFRFRWEYQPGSELFVVYTDGHDTLATAGRASLQNRGVVVKLNKLVRF